jgi:hypothetical protein
MRGLLLSLGLITGLVQAADIGTAARFKPSGGEERSVPEWVEEAARLPAFPRDGDLIEFYVSAVTANRFFVDGATLAIGPDGVIRYTLVIKTSGGASNVTYEGVRCGDGIYKLYATGRSDGTWAWMRSGDWRPIENKVANRHHAALSRELFCPLGTPIRSADEGRDALRRGRHPLAP